MTSVNLPTFDNPPVGEVVLSVQFPKISNLQAAHLGQFWDTIRADFPRTETHPAVDAIVERFEKLELAPTLRFQFRPSEIVPRAWFISTDDTRLIQVQADRFICNWRRASSTRPYPRFPEVRGFFEQYWGRWQEFLTTQRLIDGLKIEQCEVTYTNHIAKAGVWGDYGEADKVLRYVSTTPCLASELRGEFTSFSTHYLINGGSGEAGAQPVGRLHIDFDPGIDARTGEPIFILNLVARGLISSSLNDVITFFDLGRRLIVTTFKEITTPAMHRVWKLKEGG